MGAEASWDVVVPTSGRSSLAALLGALDRTIAASPAPGPGRVVVVDDRNRRGADLPGVRGRDVDVLGGRAAGPAAARNTGWRACASAWVVFLDDDVVPGADWAECLARDLHRAARGGAPETAEHRLNAGDVEGSQGRVVVPRPAGRRPTDWERNVIGLEGARWATADMAYRRAVLEETGGFDERFPRAYREDSDLGLRVTGAGHRIVLGDRIVYHPIGPSNRWTSVRRQSGNADDVLMAALHGRAWRAEGGAPRGRKVRHFAVTAAGVTALAGWMHRRPKLGLTAGALWLAGTGELAWARIAPGPRESHELVTMVLTSAVLPAAATWHTFAGLLALPRKLTRGRSAPGSAGVAGSPPNPRHSQGSAGVAGSPPNPRHSQGSAGFAGSPPNPRHSQGSAGFAGSPPNPRPEAVLFDRDGTLVVDVPYNGVAQSVNPMPGAREALDRLRRAGVALGVVTNQSGVARGLLTLEQVHAVNRRIEELLGPLDVWVVCPHGPEEGCDCRKPNPGSVLRAAAQLGVDPSRCAVVGDIGADIDAAGAAGARSVLVPTPQTLPLEVARAPEVVPDLLSAVERLLGEPVEKGPRA